MGAGIANGIGDGIDRRVDWMRQKSEQDRQYNEWLADHAQAEAGSDGGSTTGPGGKTANYSRVDGQNVYIPPGGTANFTPNYSASSGYQMYIPPSQPVIGGYGQVSHTVPPPPVLYSAAPAVWPRHNASPSTGATFPASQSPTTGAASHLASWLAQPLPTMPDYLQPRWQIGQPQPYSGYDPFRSPWE